MSVVWRGGSAVLYESESNILHGKIIDLLTFGSFIFPRSWVWDSFECRWYLSRYMVSVMITDDLMAMRVIMTMMVVVKVSQLSCNPQPTYKLIKTGRNRNPIKRIVHTQWKRHGVKPNHRLLDRVVSVSKKEVKLYLDPIHPNMYIIFIVFYHWEGWGNRFCFVSLSPFCFFDVMWYMSMSVFTKSSQYQ